MNNLNELKSNMDFGFTKEVVLITRAEDIEIYEADGGWKASNSTVFFDTPSDAIDSIGGDVLAIEVLS